jgi:EAL domain-containing protein (putative c-di-GMP-specific phosphodiesterase class I)
MRMFDVQDCRRGSEGVENEAVCDRLLALGCDAAQGVLISEPRSATAMQAWIAQRQEVT